MTEVILKLYFWDPTEGKHIYIKVDDPQENLDQATIETAMQAMIGVLVPETVQIDEAIYETTTTNEVMNLVEE
ncbi:MAG TPA: DUF2922 family protein [Candidatus Pacearchaeota archaeon]|jgi:hypothetical protein|nr:DUF2922 family protein [Candidatus Pacearchaeota archaeon]